MCIALCQGKIDSKTGGIFFGLFLATKIKYCVTIDKFGFLQEHKILKGFNNSKRLIDRSHYFKMIEGKRISTLFSKSWKKSFNSGDIVRTNMKFCIECNDKIICDRCKKSS